jgi:lipopolysaccharide/colanic/teichoic acid biosynthesis glycosyltransferase
MTLTKRLFDLVMALMLVMILSPVIAYISIRIWRQKDGPTLYRAERMKTPDQSFDLWKFRTMRPSTHNSGVTGADKNDRITPMGHILRSKRLDELPQLWNVFRGDISFVGPRPPLREYTDRFPNIYGRVLKSRPGITGLATILFHKREAQLLAECASAKETDAVYCRRCIPSKARLDIIYQNRANLCLDIWILWETLRRIFGGK